MQSFPDACAAVFEDNGGALLFSKKADRIVIRNNKTDGVLLSDDSFIQADFVVSACDARQTFLNLIDETVLSQDFLKKFKGMKPSCSCFGVHLCLGRKISRLADRCRALWVSASPDLESYYDNIKCGIVDDSFSQLLMVFPSRHDSSLAPSGKDYLFSLVNVPYKNEKFWADEKERLAERLIERVKSAVPRLSDYIVERYITTPATFEKYTLNYRGAFRGWESTISQFGSDRMPQRTEVEGLYLAGHWATTNAGQGGISVAAYSGLNAARLLIRDAKNNQDKRKVMVRV
jgi:prolycopene isomerase